MIYKQAVPAEGPSEGVTVTHKLWAPFCSAHSTHPQLHQSLRLEIHLSAFMPDHVPISPALLGHVLFFFFFNLPSALNKAMMTEKQQGLHISVMTAVKSNLWEERVIGK